MLSSSTNTILESIDLDYENLTVPINSSYFIHPNDINAGVKDELYNYKKILSLGQNQEDLFSNWKRYDHVKKNSNINSSFFGGSGNRNPYRFGNLGEYHFQTISTPSIQLPFDHGFLESPRLSQLDFFPGDRYEINTKIYAGNTRVATFDINIVSGSNNYPTNVGSSPISNSVYSAGRDKSMFSTFGNAIKWSGGANATIETSNLFVAPLLRGTEINNVLLQIGPGNSDTEYGKEPIDQWGVSNTNIGGNESSTGPLEPSAYNSYWHRDHKYNFGYSDVEFENPLNQNNNTWQEGTHPKDKVSSNFGIGLPWAQTLYLYNAGLTNSPNNTLFSGNELKYSSYFNFWWNDDSNSLVNWSNTPTLCGPNTKLKEVEIVRYAKNPYMLKSVKRYVHNFSDNTPEASGVMIQQKILERDIELNHTYEYEPIVEKVELHDPDFDLNNLTGSSNLTYMVNSQGDMSEYPNVRIYSNVNVEYDITPSAFNVYRFKLSEIIEKPTNSSQNSPPDLTEDNINSLSKTKFDYSHLNSFLTSPGQSPTVLYDLIAYVDEQGNGTGLLSDSWIFNGYIHDPNSQTPFVYKEDSKHINFSKIGSGGLVLSKITNKLGGVTRIVYNEITDKSVKIEMQSSGRTSLCAMVNSSEAEELERMNRLFTIIPTVKSIFRESEGGEKQWSYSYSSRTINSQSLRTNVNHIHRSISNSFQRGFWNTKVIEPFINGFQPYTVFTYWNDEQENLYNHVTQTAEYNLHKEMLIGKLLSVKKFEYFGSVLSEKKFDYEYSLAFESGFERLSMAHNQWSLFFDAYDYLDYGFRDHWLDITSGIGNDDSNAYMQYAGKWNDNDNDYFEFVTPPADLIENGIRKAKRDGYYPRAFLDENGVPIQLPWTTGYPGSSGNLYQLPEDPNDILPKVENPNYNNTCGCPQNIQPIDFENSSDNWANFNPHPSVDPDVLNGVASAPWISLVEPPMDKFSNMSEAYFDQRFFDKFYANTSANRYKSYFLRMTKETEKEHFISSMLPYIDESDGEVYLIVNPVGFDVTNAELRSIDSYLLNEIQVNPSDDAVIAEMNLNAPLPENVMEEILQTRPSIAFKVLMDESDLSNNILTLIVNSSYLTDKEKYRIIASKNNIGDGFLLYILDDSQGISSDLVTEIIRSQNYVSSEVLDVVLTKNDNSFLYNTLMKQPSIDPQIFSLFLINNPNFPVQFASNIIKKFELSDTSVLNAFLNLNESPSAKLIVETVVNGSKYPEEDFLIVLFDSNILSKDDKKQIIKHNKDGITDSFRAFLTDIGIDNEIIPNVAVLTDCNGTEIDDSVIETITEYGYYFANEFGYSSGSAYKTLMGLDDLDGVYLKWEPSWQLFSTKTYSPQAPDRFQQQEYYYYYDLKNRYDRHFIDGYFSSELDLDLGYRYDQYGYEDIPLIDPETGEEMVDDEGVVITSPIWNDSEIEVPVAYAWITNGGHKYFDRMDIPGMQLSRKENMMNLVFQSRKINKLGSDSPIAKSEYFFYDDSWSLDYSDLEVIYNESAGDYCPYEDDDSSGANPGTGTNWGTVYNDLTNKQVPFWELLKSKLHLRSTFSQIDTLIKKTSSYDKTYLKFGNVRLMDFENTYFDDNIDQIDQGDYYAPVFPYDVIKTGEIHERNFNALPTLIEDEKGLKTRIEYSTPKKYWYPATSTCNAWSIFVVLNNGLPNSITEGAGFAPENDRSDALTTNFEYYVDKTLKKIILPNEEFNLFEYDLFGNLEKKYLNDNLLQEYQYHYLPGDWNNLSFDERALQNYVTTKQYLNSGNLYANISKQFVDPLGRNYGAVTHAYGNDEFFSSGTITYDAWNRPIKYFKQLESFSVANDGFVPQYNNLSVYSRVLLEPNQRGRKIKEAKVGRDINGSSTIKYKYDLINGYRLSCDLNLDIYEEGLLIYGNKENNLFSRVKTEDEDGKISYSYSNALGQLIATRTYNDLYSDEVTLMVYDNYGNLTKVINPEKQESDYHYNIMGWLYEKESPDTDKIKYMFNKSGQVVLEEDANCRKGIPMPNSNNNRPYVRRYNYDIYGNVILQGKYFAESEYATSTSGLELNDELEPVSFSGQLSPVLYEDHPLWYNLDGYWEYYFRNDNGHLLYYVGYDLVDLETHEIVENPNLIPIYPSDERFHYSMTNNSTYAWKASVLTYQFNGDGGFPIHELGLFPNDITQKEKKYFYGESPIGSNPGWTPGILYGNEQLTNSNDEPIGTVMVPQYFYDTDAGGTGLLRRNLKGRLSHTLTYDNRNETEYYDQDLIQMNFYSYNDEGQLLWEMQQQNINGITPEAKGMLLRIDYPKYNLQGSVMKMNIDFNCDQNLDMQYHYEYDAWNRIKRVYVTRTDGRVESELFCTYNYDNITGAISSIVYSQDETDASINRNIYKQDFTYNVRDQLVDLTSSSFGLTDDEDPNVNFFNYHLYYDDEQLQYNGTDLVHDLNFNGNINASKTTYSFGNSSGEIGIAPTNFNEPTNYGYSYDGINRLVAADAIVGDAVAGMTNTNNPQFQTGDVSIEYDKIGNILSLDRYGFYNTAAGENINNHLESYLYSYEPGNNHLIHTIWNSSANGQGSNYAYDDNGNLMFDSKKGIKNIEYGNSNLPILMKVDPTPLLPQDPNETLIENHYYYGINDERIAKQTIEGNQILNSEIYWRNAMGQEIAVLNRDLENDGAQPYMTYYVYGKERFAKFRLEGEEIGLISNMLYGDYNQIDASDKNNSIKNKIIENSISNTGAVYPLVLAIGEQDNEPMVYLYDYYDNVLKSDSSTTFIFKNKLLIKSEDQLIKLDRSDGKGKISVSIADIIDGGTGARALDPGQNVMYDSFHNNTINGIFPIVPRADYYQYDHLGNTRIIFTREDNQLDLGDADQSTIPINNLTSDGYYHFLFVADYYPYGKILRKFVSDQSLDGDERYQTTYHERDKETNYDFRGARYYDSDIGRFLSTDPLAADYMAWSTYNYVLGNPVMMTDADGKSATCPTCPDNEDYDVFRKSDIDFTYNKEDGSVSRTDLDKRSPIQKVVDLGYKLDSKLEGGGGSQPDGYNLVSDKGGESPDKTKSETNVKTLDIQVLLDLGAKHTKNPKFSVPSFPKFVKKSTGILKQTVSPYNGSSSNENTKENKTAENPTKIHVLKVDSMVGDGKGGAILWNEGKKVYNGSLDGLININFKYKQIK